MVQDMNLLRLEMVKGRDLASMAADENIKWPVDKGHNYVDFNTSGKRLITNVMAASKGEVLRLAKHFQHRGNDYIIQFVDGCFYPFVFHAKKI